MRKADEGDEVVAARLRVVLAPVDRAVRAPGARPPDFADRSPVAWSELVPSWPEDVDLGPSAPVSPAGGVQVSRGGPAARGGPASLGAAADLGVRDPWGPSRASSQRADSSSPPSLSAGDAIYVADRSDRPDRFEGGDGSAGDDEVERPRSPALSGAGAFGAGARWGAFDPGRRGTKALAVVAAVVVLVAGFLAWRARPRVDPIAEAPPVAEGSADVPEPVGNNGSAPAAVVVAVEGKVGKPGVVRLPAGARVADALAAAGGARPGVDTAMLNLARKVVDGELILVGIAPSPGSVVATGPAAAPGAPAGPVNLNTATLADLDTLPGVGPVLAQRIIDARTAQGGFRAVSDLRKVDGIGSSRYDQLKELVRV